MSSQQSEKRSFLWDLDAVDEDRASILVDDFSSRVPEATGTPRNARNIESEVGTVGTLGTSPETLTFGRSDFDEGSRNSRNAPSLKHRLSPPDLPGVHANWTAGVYRLQTMRPPCDIDERRWDRFRYDALRLLHEHGAALHAAGWSEVDVFGLHRLAPGRRPDGMGLAWLVRNAVVVMIAAESVSIKADDGVVQRVFRRGGHARLVSVAAWDMDSDQK